MSKTNIGSIIEAQAVFEKAVGDELARIRSALTDRTLSKVAHATGLHENTVRNIAKAHGSTPTVETIEKLSQYLFTQNA